MTKRTLLLSLLLVAGCGEAVRPRSGQNVVFITIDTLRADRLGAYGYRDARTLHIDALAERGVLFEEAIAQVPLTLPSHASLFTGLNPPSHGVRDNASFRLGDESETLAEVLERNGYETAAFVGAYVLDSAFGLDQGFEVYDDELPGGGPEVAGTISERKGEEVTRAFATWLEKHSGKRPFFVWLHYFDPHLPYAPPPPYPASYDGEIAYVDDQIGRLLEALREKGIYDDTLVVLTSDHGESLGEHREKSHGFFVYDATLRVPLIFAGPLTPPRRVAGTVRTIDVLPTVLEALALSAPGGVQGRSLFDRFSGDAAEAPASLPAYAECYAPQLNFHWAPLLAIRDQGFKYIEAPRPELYDLARDPEETKNLADVDPETAERLRSRLAAELESWPDSLSSRLQPDPETVERLRALGYAGSSGASTPAVTELADPKDRIHLWTRLQEVILAKAAGDLEEAAKGAISVLEEDPENLLALELLADARSRAGTKEEARLLYERILALDPSRPSAQVAYGGLLWQAGDVTAAEKSFRAALETDPAFATAHRRLGELLLSRGRAAEAAESFGRAAESAERESDELSARLGLARSLRSAGRADEAMRELESLYQRHPSAPGVVAEYAGALAQGGDVERALAVLSRGPDHADVHYTTSVLFRSRGEMDRALGELERALALDPRMAPALHDRGVILSRMGRLSDAVESLENAIAVRDAAPSRNALGTALCRMERCPEAIVHFERAVELAPDFGEALENLAQAYWIAGRRAEAERAQKRADALKSVR